jgi:hypothetical protein
LNFDPQRFPISQLLVAVKLRLRRHAFSVTGRALVWLLPQRMVWQRCRLLSFLAECGGADDAKLSSGRCAGSHRLD